VPFVDLGGVDGLVHVSELSWKHIDHPSEVVEVGQEVEVEVLDVDLDRERVSLSLKATQEDPWRQFARTHAIQQIVPGKVTKLVPFGAFVRVDDGIEGLVHISELAERHVEIPEQVVQVGSDVMVKVIDIDLERRRISLSLKQANEGFVEGEEHFDPTLYGMAATYDTEGNYVYPDGLRPGDRRVARGLRQAARGVGAAVRRGPPALGGPHQAGADGPRRRHRPGRPDLGRSDVRRYRDRGQAGRGAPGHPRHRRGPGRAEGEAGRRQELTLLRSYGPRPVTACGRARLLCARLSRIEQCSRRIGVPVMRLEHCFMREVDLALGGVGDSAGADGGADRRDRVGQERGRQAAGRTGRDRDRLRRTGARGGGPGTDGLAEVVATFGPRAVTADGEMDRAAVAEIVFGDEEKAPAAGEDHPSPGAGPGGRDRGRGAARRRGGERRAAAGRGEPGRHYDLVIVVLADETVRLDRLVRFRGMTEETARARFAAQATDEQRRAVADIVIENDGTPAELRAAVDAVWERLAHERAARGGR
jgi:predicted RNA-binding protein with RPS1 domain